MKFDSKNETTPSYSSILKIQITIFKKIIEAMAGKGIETLLEFNMEQSVLVCVDLMMKINCWGADQWCMFRAMKNSKITYTPGKFVGSGKGHLFGYVFTSHFT